MQNPLDSISIGNSLIFSDPVPASRGDGLDSFTATFSSRGINAAVVVDADIMSEELADLFDDLEANWRGWSGEKAWESIEHDLRLSCTHDGLGHVKIKVEMQAYTLADWSVMAYTIVEAGQLTKLAKDLRGFLCL